MCQTGFSYAQHSSLFPSKAVPIESQAALGHFFAFGERKGEI
jgi:hypothetical protein